MSLDREVREELRKKDDAFGNELVAIAEFGVYTF